MKKILLTVAAAAICIGLGAQNRPNWMTVEASAEGIPVQKTMYGQFFEDINFAADGGLYAEKIMNRSFEYDNNLQGWKTFGKVTLKNDGPFENNPHYVTLSYSGHPVRKTGLENSGIFGIGVEKGKEYRFTVWARTSGKAKKEAITVMLCNPTANIDPQFFCEEELVIDSPKWKKYELILTPRRTDPKASLRILLSSTGYEMDPASSVDLEHISLFPVDTYNGDENGLRRDIAEVLAEMKPGILRFPGGCIVEGATLDTRYQWKKTVGPVENRPVNENRWIYDQYNRMFPDYYQSGGLGFYEYFRFAEEMGAEPLPVLSCGMACQFENDMSIPGNMVPLEELQPYIDDALDLIEFANGSPKSKWGKVRAEMGHPEPFNLKYLAVGNENWTMEYVKRLEAFKKAINKKYPEIKIVGSSGPYSGGEWFNELWGEMRRLDVDLVDEHFYSWEGFYENNADRYDNYPRNGSKVFAGEYACHGSDGKKYNHFNAALVEAAFMTGFERNADVVYMTCYAPLLSHVEGWQWRPDLVWFDNLNVMRSCSYYVQKLYSTNKGTRVVPLTMAGKPVANKEGQHQLCASSVVDDRTGEIIVKVANLSNYSQEINLNIKGAGELKSCSLTTLHSDNPIAENTIENPYAVVPVEREIDLARAPRNEYEMGLRKAEDGSPVLSDRIGPRTFAVYKFATR
ncbi:MAG: alpha-L-arabinofuranosidase C-terminal domain-containing protein [Candidatus Cryptobacteroides sp.]